MRRVFRVGLAVAMGLPMLAACSRDSVAKGEARVEPHGVVEVAKPGAGFARINEATTVKDGARVRVQNGTAEVRLPVGELALRQGSEVVLGPSPELVAGDLLVVPAQSLTVKSAGSEFAVKGASKLTRSFAVTVGSYEEGVGIRSAGSTLDVPALRQASIAALGQVPARAEPLQYAATDGWDRRFLADAIDLGLELDARSQSASAQFRGQGSTPGFYRTLMPQLDSQPEFTSELINAARPPGEHLVGAAIALAGSEGTFRSRWDRAFAFRGEGAQWGLVAMDQRVQRVGGIVQQIDEALGRSRLPADETRVAQPGQQASTTTRPANRPTSTSTTRRQNGSTTTSSTTTTTEPDEPSPIVGVPIIDDTIDTIGGLLPGG